MFSRLQRISSWGRSTVHTPHVAPSLMGVMLLVTALFSLLGGPSQAGAQTLPVAGDGEHLWVVQPGDQSDQFTVLHRSEDDKPGLLHHVQTLHGQLADHGLAAASGSLWLVYDDGTVQTIHAQPSPNKRSWTYESRIRRELPSGTKIKAITIHQDTLWALLSATSAKTLKTLDQANGSRAGRGTANRPQAGPESEQRNLALGLPPGATLAVPENHADRESNSSDAASAEGSNADSRGQTNQNAGQHSPDSGKKKAPPEARTKAPANPERTQKPDESDASDNGKGKGKGKGKGEGKGKGKGKGKAESKSEAQGQAQDRLVVMRGERWQNVPLPDDWPNAKEAVLITNGDESSAVVLITRTSGGDKQALRVYRREQKSWQETEARASGFGQMAAVIVDQQIVVGRQTNSQAKSNKPKTDSQNAGLVLSVVRADESTRIGTLDMPGLSPGNWALTPLGFHIGIIGRKEGAKPATGSKGSPNSQADGKSANKSQSDDSSSPEGGKALGLMLATMDLQGNVVTQPRPLKLEPEPRFINQADYLIMIAVLALATGFMLLFWQRDPRKQRLRLPEGYVLASFPRRALAGLIDFAPAFIVGLFAFDLSARELLIHWPGQPAAASWAQLIPGLTVIALVLAHTTLAELIWARSLGKALTGLHVRSLSSRPAKPRQILIRGLMRLFDLIAWLLLLLPVISPFRQRLGDLIARTVVVMAKPEDDDSANGGEDKQ